MWMICPHAREDREKRMNNTIACRILPRSMTPPLFKFALIYHKLERFSTDDKNAECTTKTRRREEPQSGIGATKTDLTAETRGRPWKRTHLACSVSAETVSTLELEACAPR